MKRLIIFSIIVCLLSCQKAEIIPTARPSDTEQTTKTKKIHFGLKVVDEDWNDTRAGTAETLSQAGCCRLLVFDVVNGDIVSATDISDTDAAWTDLSLNLTYDHHTVLFVAMADTAATYTDEGIIQFSRLSQSTFFCKKEFDVTKTSGSTYSVSMERMVAQCCVVIEDAIPAELSQVQVSMTNYCDQFDVLHQRGISPYICIKSVGGWSNYIGCTGESITFHTVPLTLTDEYTASVTVSLVDGNGHPLATETADNVPFEAGYITTLTGCFLGVNECVSVRCNSVWNRKETVRM